jgi:hypothetical protein
LNQVIATTTPREQCRAVSRFVLRRTFFAVDCRARISED